MKFVSIIKKNLLIFEMMPINNNSAGQMNRRNFGSFPESPTKESKKMRKHQNCCDYCDYYEYHGNTEIERIRIRAGETIHRDWLNFDSVAGAMEYFNTECGEFMDDPGRGSGTVV